MANSINDSKNEHNLETITKTYLFYLSENIFVDAVELYHENRHYLISSHKEEQGPYATFKLINEKKENLLKEYIGVGFKLVEKFSTKDQQKYDCSNTLNALCFKLINQNYDVYLEIYVKEINPDDVAINKKGESFYDGKKIIFSLDK